MKNRSLVVILLLALQLILIQSVSFDENGAAEDGLKTVRKIPIQIGGWQGTDFPLDPEVFQILETNAILHRSYSNGNGASVFLSIVYYRETKVDFHAPESCLGGQGIRTVKDQTRLKITMQDGTTREVPVNRLMQQNGNEKRLIYYFYKSGPFAGPDYIKLRLNLILNKFRNAKKSGSLIRISTKMKDSRSGLTEADRKISQFLGQLYPYLLQYL